MRDVHRFTQEALRKRHDTYIARNAGLHRPHTFKAGDTVRLHRIYPGKARSGTDKAWFWPFRPELYTITDSVSSQHVKIQRAATPDHPAGRTRAVHVARLKPYNPRDDALRYADIRPTLETPTGV